MYTLSNITATCGPPFSPVNGIITPYTLSNTLEGAMVTYVCWTVHQSQHQSICQQMNATAICNSKGNWEPNSENICAEPSDLGKINYK